MTTALLKGGADRIMCDGTLSMSQGSIRIAAIC